ncbi:hypothetical protein GCG54_00008181 [Colletotrichum gloeosporioides]|uniref:Uncharacterized protein n=1 Tax=Colletotrichum gloeosporioides TaxID=474922 RepID=A0A8H4C7L8_COLGL|nr:uncharacterized protein GCG54_00008181 [Colletotrichum gloeosporioides]KAF3798727.1 hypothetical protein GCG54_00008181 [Colletotrichum gloeosporioides]
MASSGEFDGDDFSNNLFSDLAPLLTLFGEQVTIQFLSLSMGWADNFLIAMGPLGIITTVISAIRIGGGRTLKTLIGRARETQAVSEQELLSSTSSNVCELWNGQQVTRIIGEPKETSTVVISRDGTIYTLRRAYRNGLITIKNTDSNASSSSHRDVHNNYNSKRSTGNVSNNSQSDQNEEYIDDANSASLDLPTNLTLNTRSAPASKLELWSWAALGIALQTIALVFPGITTHYWKWNKGDSPVAAYGYPCFVVGTVSLTIGLILCGHIIEGATIETDFALTKESKRQGLKFICLQKALSLGDQEYPACAIILAPTHGILTTSRSSYLNLGHVWSGATLSTFLTISGYVVQFVGLRALHWSAAIVQLAVTIAMTVVRAFARRNLASTPTTSDLGLQLHFIPWLTQQLRLESEKGPMSKGAQSGLGKLFKRLRHKANREEEVDSERLQFFCELISDHSEESSIRIDSLDDIHFSASSALPMRDMGGYICSQLLQRTARPLQVSFEFRTGDSVENDEPETHGAAESLRIHAQIVSGTPKTMDTPEKTASARASKALCKVIEKVMGLLIGSDEFIWDEQIEALLTDKKRESPLRIYWGFDMREGRVSGFREKEATQKHVRVAFRRALPDRLWHLDSQSRSQLWAAISLSLYTDAYRWLCADGQARQTKQTADAADHDFRRIVGYAANAEVSEKKAKIQEWLTCSIDTGTSSILREEEKRVSLQKIIDEATGKSNEMTAGLRQPMQQKVSRRPKISGRGAEDMARRIKRGVSKSYLGVFLSSSADDLRGYKQSEFEEFLVKTRPKVSKGFQYAQELFSLFILAVASKTHSVKGKTVRKVPEDGTGRVFLENSIFKSIAEIVLEEELAKSKDEAYTLIIPAFFKHNLLPTQLTQPDQTYRQETESDEFSPL